MSLRSVVMSSGEGGMKPFFGIKGVQIFQIELKQVKRVSEKTNLKKKLSAKSTLGYEKHG